MVESTVTIAGYSDDERWTTFTDLMEKYKYYSGKWHDRGCYFPEVDHAVCNCRHYEIEGVVKQHLLNL